MKTHFRLWVVAMLVLGPAIKAPGATVWAWGDNTYGETNVPPSLTNIVAVSAGADYCLALNAAGEVAAWGHNQYGQCNVPPTLGEVVSISAYDDQNLALRGDGTVVAWGAYGNDVPTNLGGVIAVAKALWCSLALKPDGTIVAWPKNSYFGQSDVPADLTNAVAISGGGNQCLALRADGTVTAWPLAVGASTFAPVPEGITNALAISAGYRHNLALLATGKVIAWGDTNGGACDVPLDLTNAVAVSAGYFFSLALKADGTIVSWGNGAPVAPQAASGVTMISAGVGLLGMALGGAQGGLTTSFISPQTETIGSGSQAFFSVAASGAAPLSYQWYFFGTNAIPGATNRWLSFPNALPSQSGLYSVVVSNAQSSATSPSVTLDVVPSLDISLAPAIKLKGSPGSTFSIQYVNGLGPTNDWAGLTTVTLTNSQQYYVDLSAIGQPPRLYRLVQLP